MSDTYIIEVRSELAGIVVRDRGGFRFFAASETFQRMEGQYSRSAREAEREAQVQLKLRGEGGAAAWGGALSRMQRALRPISG